MAMRRDPMFLTVALSSAVLFLAAGHAQAQGSRTYVLRSGVVTVAPETRGDVQVLCHGSDFATGGGLVTSASEFHAEKMTVSDSFAISDASGEGTLDNAGPHGWRVIVFNPLPAETLESLEVQAFVVCTSASELTVSATGSGTVSSNEGSIRCPATCTATYNSGTSVTLTASPDIGSVFGGWSGCDTVADTTCTVIMSAARSVTAAFNAQP